ncbi:sorting nexin 2B-like [Nicotiana sylvestris]|uniref:Sorting nexin 2B-like isoform X1 n=1 Tax=Nicotiana sylvestris TaxID=4096 RepID=A0A1U7XIF1_NICSY|nr:PREDICTED: sorting nexin 2B-like isoform X1 [Nicotiana sylvestris]
MMGYENQSYEESHLYASKEEMESLVLNDDSSNGAHSFSDPLSASSLPFAEIPADQSQTPNSFNSILEPPSYAEAIFRSFDADQSPTEINGHDHSIVSPSSSPSSSSEFLRISVSDPLKEQELTNSLVPGGSNYVTYLITTRTNLPDFDGTEFSVRRRFRDVVTLSDRLAESYRGFFIPLRPDKSVVESQVMQKQEFLEQRRAALEKYLRRLAAHPVIRRSEELRMFLEANGKLPLVRTTDVASRMLDGAVKLPKQMFSAETVGGGMVDVNEVAQPAKGGRDLLRIFKELKQSVTYDWGGVKPQVVEEDKELLEKKEKLQDFEQQLSNVSQQAEALVKAQQDIGETMGQMGLAFVKLTKFETEQAVYDSQRTRAADMKNVATAAVKASRLYRELNAQTVKHLDKLHEYLGVMLAVNNAFSDRSSALLTVQTLLSELSSLNSRIEKLEAASSKIFGGDRSRIRKIEELKETLRVTEDAKSSAVSEYERIKENNKNELERFEKERHDDFLGMLRGFIVNQAGYAEKMANVWETVAEETSGYAKHGS